MPSQRIAAIETAELVTRYPRTIGRNARLGSHGSGPTATAVQLRTDGGSSGWGLVGSGGLGGLAALVGAEVGTLFDPSIGVIDPRASALDFALHDLVAKDAGVPVHELLGGRGETSVPCYSGAIYFDDLDPDDVPRGVSAVLENCASDRDAGYRAFKLKIGRGHRWMDAEAGFARDVEVTRAVREAYPDARILVDANNGFSPLETIRYLRAVADCDLYWLEEPFHEDAEGLRLVRDFLRESGSSTLIADGEFEPDEAQVLELAGAGLIDVLLMDVVSFGLTDWRRVMPAVRASGAAASPHAWGLPIKTYYAAQMAAGLGSVRTVEGVPGVSDGLDASGYDLLEGVLTVPEAPGFGLELTATTHPVTPPR
ncbi:enolase C-terminal domain-like protein [Occultella gossypii]|uniref:Mandelate racemase n=1 Tax=Occultella gossypii TaxID=2800820 RepID=A0ABS7SH86_9MICO|nr:enolase C-terminal domain-like protein [Occultella gossypii]MBZ2199709.1 mandelate racemase [Occultella gossypii]